MVVGFLNVVMYSRFQKAQVTVKTLSNLKAAINEVHHYPKQNIKGIL
jgi:hypothetical protein